MLNPRLIKKRVSSIKNIGKITKALEMVSASKVQRAQTKALNAKPYARAIFDLIGNLSRDLEATEIPLMRVPYEIKNDLYVLISTNRGLAGSLNTNLFRKLNEHLKTKNTQHSFVTLGKKGRFIASINGKLEADFSESYDTTSTVAAVVKIITDGFIQGTYDEVYIVYSEFVSALTQEPSIKKILPISREELEKEEESEVFELIGKREDRKTVDSKPGNFSYEPDSITVLSNLLPYYLEIQLTESLFEAQASEHSSRMIAMKNASDNASELSSILSLEYNKARQSMITTEISDITTAQASLH